MIINYFLNSIIPLTGPKKKYIGIREGVVLLNLYNFMTDGNIVDASKYIKAIFKETNDINLLGICLDFFYMKIENKTISNSDIVKYADEIVEENKYG